MDTLLTSAMKSSIRQAIDTVMRAEIRINITQPIPIKRVFLKTCDELVSQKVITRPEVIGGSSLGGQNFMTFLGGEQPSIFPNYEIPPHIAQFIRFSIWDIFLQGFVLPSYKRRQGIDASDIDSLIFFLSFEFTELGKEYFGKDQAPINVYDPDGYLSLLYSANPKPDEEMLKYLTECLLVFKANHLLSSMVLLGIASERLIEVLALSLRDSMGGEKGNLWYTQKFKNKRDVSERFKSLHGKLKDEYGEELKMARLSEGLDLVVSLTFESIRIARNDIAHRNGKEILSCEVAGFLYNFSQYFFYINSIIKYLTENPKKH
jgi:hypothetical protein